MAELRDRRVFVEDLRREGSFLRCTWRPRRGAFVLSVWQGDVCTGSVQLSPPDAARLNAALAEGLAETLEDSTVPGLDAR